MTKIQNDLGAGFVQNSSVLARYPTTEAVKQAALRNLKKMAHVGVLPWDADDPVHPFTSPYDFYVDVLGLG